MERPQKIVPCLWFDTQAEEAAQFYTSLFESSGLGPISRYSREGVEVHGQPEGAIMTVAFQLGGYELLALNGGPHFSFTPAISFFVVCETAAELEGLWEALAAGGAVLMELDRYDWSERYGWLMDRYGLSWQLSLGEVSQVGQAITPSLLFVGDQCGRAEEALRLYTSTFRDSSVNGILRFSPEETPSPEGLVKHAQFTLEGEVFMVMDSPFEHSFTFNEAVSFMVRCHSQEEIDRFWQALSEDGEEGPCGWLKDRFGVSWQVVPTGLDSMLRDPDPDRVARVTRAFLGMKKLDLEVLEEAYA
jgi:predicted 3-demethylubiquinone-9 3-methyltransferase (glyoxalase superfamily)